MANESLYRGPVLTDTGHVFVQCPDETPWGFSLHDDDDKSWSGGFGPWAGWLPVDRDDPRITDDDRRKIDDIMAMLDDQEERG